MRVSHRMIVALAGGAGLVTGAFAGPPVTESFAACRAEAETLYGNDGDGLRVRLDGVRKGGKELRLRVVTGDGQSFNAVCSVGGEPGERVALDPQQVPGRERQLTAAES